MLSEVTSSPPNLGAPWKFSPAKCVTAALHTLPPGLAGKISALLYSVQPHRLLVLPELAKLSLKALAKPGKPSPLPNRNAAANKPKGLSGLAVNVTPSDTLAGYAKGFFLFSHMGPLKWWAPEQRMVLFFDETRVEKNTRRLLRNNRFKVTFDTAFADVLDGCSEQRDGRPPLTWITPRMKSLFTSLHEQGQAHSVEVWNQEGALVGGLYGVAVGDVFYTESQFHRERDASKVAFAVLNAHLAQWGFAMNDGKHHTSYLEANGFRLIPRKVFSKITTSHRTSARTPGPWTRDDALDVDKWAMEKTAPIAGETLAPRATTTDQVAGIVKF